MPCRSDYQEPNEMERELAKVRAITEETKTKTGKIPSYYHSPSEAGTYNNTTKEDLDKETASLCAIFSKMGPRTLNKMSLESQMWWRDHQESDKRRLQEQMKNLKDQAAKEKALKKLTPREKKLLGIN